MAMFRALVLREAGGKVVPRVEKVDEASLPPGEVTVGIECSTLNYKDGMILEGRGRLVRSYPHIPGVDFAGSVLRSDAPEFAAGDPVVLTGWRVGETHGAATPRRRGSRPPFSCGVPTGSMPAGRWRSAPPG